jgi:hypothetical protein
MRRIRKAAVREGVGRKQEAELIVDAGLRNGLERENRDSRRDGEDADQNNGKYASFGEAAECGLDSRGPRPGLVRNEEREQQTQQRKRAFNPKEQNVSVQSAMA